MGSSRPPDYTGMERIAGNRTRFRMADVRANEPDCSKGARLRSTRPVKDADRTREGVIVRRHKGSLANITRWCPELQEAWDWLANRRNEIWRDKPVVPRAPGKRVLLVTEAGNAVGRPMLNSAWQRAMEQVVKGGATTAKTRFGLHALKHREG